MAPGWPVLLASIGLTQDDQMDTFFYPFVRVGHAWLRAVTTHHMREPNLKHAIFGVAENNSDLLRNLNYNLRKDERVMNE